MTTTAKPTIVLVHGGFADASSWSGVIEQLQSQGYTVVAPANPLRGITIDSAYIASFVSQIDNPVLLVGHSYGGAVITNAASRVDNVAGLVYVAAFVPDEGEALQDIERDSKDSILNSALTELKYPTGQGSETAPEFVINPAQFREAFAADLPEKQTTIMAVTQRAFSALGFIEPSGPPAWRNIRSWAVVPAGDKAAGADVLRTMAQRAGAEITELEGSHAIMISQPVEVANTILKAAQVISTQGALPQRRS